MIEILRAILLGVVQGLTEFLPVSSSGHLEIAKFILRDQSVGEASLLMTVVLHIATAMSTIVVFRQDIRALLEGLLSFQWNEEWRFAWKIALSMIPAVVIALTLEERLESLFSQNLILVGAMLLVTGTLLLLADRAKSTVKSVGWLDALTIGLAQAVALLPGISRSGATISTSVLLGIDREKAARFSFLMVVPLILGYIPKKLLSSEFRQTGLDDVQWLPLMAGFVAAFISGYFACRWMIELVKKARLTYFSIYCYLVGLAAIGWVVFNNQQPSGL